MRYIALLRGINVGGNTMVKMTDLKAAFEGCAFENVVTYINSGNIAFDANSGAYGTLAETLENAIHERFKKRIPVIIRKQNEIADVIDKNPFAGEFESHKEMHVLFLAEEMPEDKFDQFLAAASTKERFALRGRELFCHLPLGVVESLLGKSFIEKKLKMIFTARNWRTVERLALL